ncbi:MAG: M28 family peptidase [Gemmatimonadales bacterium]|nr:M28 family peptidase [Gemmatimonadales bacterium]
MRVATFVMLAAFWAAGASPRPAGAQAPPPTSTTATAASTRAASTISAADVQRRIGIIADDSMAGRDTPSPGLESTARYVAGEFARLGLRPGGDSGSFLQRYAITERRLRPDSSRVVFSGGGRRATAEFTASARYLFGPVPGGALHGRALVVSPSITAEQARRLDVRDRVVLVRAGTGPRGSGLAERIVRSVAARLPIAVILLADDDSATFAARLPRRSAMRTVIGDPPGPVALEVRTGAVAAVLDARDVRVRVEMRDDTVRTRSAPNAVGILRGSDPRLRNEYVIFSAHMDHIGITPGAPDSINNGADDDASGTTGVLELAEAFSRPGARPKRSLIFLTVSGEEQGLWGSRHFTDHPPVPIRQIVADLNMDMIGRNWTDTIVAIGREHADLGATLAQVNAAHPELRMTAIGDRWPEERFYFRSDHYNFARLGVPVLFFFNGVHPDYHQVTDSPDKIDAEKESRVVRLVYWLGQAVGNAPRRPQWNPESYKEIVDGS